MCREPSVCSSPMSVLPSRPPLSCPGWPGLTGCTNESPCPRDSDWVWPTESPASVGGGGGSATAGPTPVGWSSPHSLSASTAQAPSLPLPLRCPLWFPSDLPVPFERVSLSHSQAAPTCCLAPGWRSGHRWLVPLSGTSKLPPRVRGSVYHVS